MLGCTIDLLACSLAKAKRHHLSAAAKGSVIICAPQPSNTAVRQIQVLMLPYSCCPGKYDCVANVHVVWTNNLNAVPLIRHFSGFLEIDQKHGSCTGHID